jgi:8-oxo-dGTP diphosphatase
MEFKKQKVVVVALIRDKEGKILLQKRVDAAIPEAHGKWEFPGGVVEFGENPKDAVIRECQEEIMCTIRIIRLLPLLHTGMWQRTDGQAVQAFVSCFEAEVAEGTPKPGDPREVSEVQWFTKEEVASLDSLPATNDFMELIE